MRRPAKMIGATMVLRRTERGFVRADFRDEFCEECSIQESASVDAPRIWLGRNDGSHHPVTGSCLSRMHLGREQAATLAALLIRFARTGRLAPAEIVAGELEMHGDVGPEEYVPAPRRRAIKRPNKKAAR